VTKKKLTVRIDEDIFEKIKKAKNVSAYTELLLKKSLGKGSCPLCGQKMQKTKEK
jgi:ssDNA-binding Zn-finger/Zn-ribbon topoisomerase 1